MPRFFKVNFEAIWWHRGRPTQGNHFWSRYYNLHIWVCTRVSSMLKMLYMYYHILISSMLGDSVKSTTILALILIGIQWSLYYKATHFADRFWPYKGVGLCRQVNLVINWQVNAEGSGLMIQVGLCSQGPYGTGTTVLKGSLLQRPTCIIRPDPLANLPFHYYINLSTKADPLIRPKSVCKIGGLIVKGPLNIM